MPLASHPDAPALFVSDLDFTLLRSDATLSPRTIDVVNRLVRSGHHFTVATRPLLHVGRAGDGRAATSACR